MFRELSERSKAIADLYLSMRNCHPDNHILTFGVQNASDTYRDRNRLMINHCYDDNRGEPLS